MAAPQIQQMYDQGRLAYESGQFDRAGAIFVQLLQKEPRNVHFLLGLASCERKRLRFDNAMKLLQKAAKLKPMMPELHCAMGDIDRICLNDEQAITHYQRTLAIRKHYPPAVGGLADLYRKLNRYDEAIELIRGAIQATRAPDPGLAEAYTAIAARAQCEAEAIAYIRSVLETQLPPITRSTLLFGLAGMLDRVGEHAPAWDAVVEASKLKRQKWDPDAYTRLIDKTIEFWTRERLRDLPTSGLETSEPVFIVGMPRSGTSLVEQIIAAHSEGAGAGELNEMMAIAARFQQHLPRPMPGFLFETGGITEQGLKTQAEGYLAHARGVSARLGDFAGAKRIVDKLPYNFQVLPMIQMLFPKATVIHTVRDPRDVCVSCYFQNFLGPIGYAYDVGHLAQYCADYQRLMAHLKTVLDLPILDVRYERLVTEPEPVIRKILTHVGLPYDENCLNFHASKRAVHTASVEQVRRPMYTSSSGRWKRYGDRALPLVEALRSAGVQLAE